MNTYLVHKVVHPRLLIAVHAGGWAATRIGSPVDRSGRSGRMGCFARSDRFVNMGHFDHSHHSDRIDCPDHSDHSGRSLTDCCSLGSSNDGRQESAEMVDRQDMIEKHNSILQQYVQ